MRKLLAAALLTAVLPGCAVVGVGIAGIAADNIAQGNSSYTNRGLDVVCDKTSGQERLADGTCPSGK